MIGTWATYRALFNVSIVHCFFRFANLNNIPRLASPQQFRFPTTSGNIESIVGIGKPKDIGMLDIYSKEKYDRFVRQVNEWLTWFDRFFNIFYYIVEWLKTCNVGEAADIFIDFNNIRNNEDANFIQMRDLVEKTVRLLKPLSSHLRRLCHLFNCSTPFRTVLFGGIDQNSDSSNYVRESKHYRSNNTFTVEGHSLVDKKFSISDRQNVQWFLASEKHPCNIDIEYRKIGSTVSGEKIFPKINVPIDKHVLHGEFETQYAGRLIIVVDNHHAPNSRTIWFQIKSTSLSICHLFQGIFNSFYRRYFSQSEQLIQETELDQLLVQVFKFIDSLLNGTIKLREMTDLKIVFYDKNIDVRDEVKKLFTNSSTTQRTDKSVVIDGPSPNDIEQVCEWLQIYQYYCHINIIIDCIRQFDILPMDHEDESIGHLKQLSSNENISLRDRGQVYKILHQRFQTLASQHLHLIKTSVECSDVIRMMKESDLYSSQGRHRFQELRDNLTTQFQLQERNNMILNSLIITYSLCEPFIMQAKTLEEFVHRLAELRNFEESSLKHMKGKTYTI